MKLKKRDFAFFALGGFVFLLGSLFTPFQNGPLEAQNTDVQVFDMIKCRGLLVVDAADEPKVVLSVGKDGGGVSVLNKPVRLLGCLGLAIKEEAFSPLPAKISWIAVALVRHNYLPLHTAVPYLSLTKTDEMSGILVSTH